MIVRGLIIAASLLGAAPALAQPASQQQAAQNAVNWDIFLKLYPRRALEAKEEGAVGFTVTLDNKGDVTNCRVTHSSGHPLLDQETCKLITLNAVFKPDPALGPSQSKTHDGVIAWKLPNSTATVAAPTAIAANAAPEQISLQEVFKDRLECQLRAHLPDSDRVGQAIARAAGRVRGPSGQEGFHPRQLSHRGPLHS